jgi:hypothetical protein
MNDRRKVLGVVEQPEVDRLLSRLLDVPSRIVYTIQGFSEAELHTAPSEGEWSAAGIFAHVRASDDIVAYRAYTILVRDNPPLIAYDERRWAEVARYALVDMLSSLTVYTLRRNELVHMLRQVPLDQWNRVGTHEERGVLSLLQMMTTFVEHEEEHCAQLEAVCHR